MLGEAFAVWMRSGLIAVVVYTCALILMLHKLRKCSMSQKAALFFIMAVCVAIGFLNILSYRNQKLFAKKVAFGYSCNLSGKIYDIKQDTNRMRLFVKADKIDAYVDGDIVSYIGKMKVLVYVPGGETLKHGQPIRISGQIAVPDGSRNPGAFDAEKYYNYQGIFLVVNDGAIIEKGKSRSFFAELIKRVKMRLQKACSAVFSEKESGIISAMLLGDKAAIDKDTKRLYQINGIAHILAISGVHIGMLGMCLYNFLRRRIGSYQIAGVISVLLILAYGYLTGMANSCARAVVMMIVVVVGNALGRTTDIVSSAAVALVIINSFNPYAFLDAGFQLSFGAIAGIAIVNPVFQEMTGCIRKRRLFKNQFFSGFAARLLDSVLVSLSVSLVITPVIIFYYYEFPLYGIFLNLLIIPLVSIILISALLAVVFGLVWSLFGWMLGIPAKLVLWIYDGICRFVMQLPMYNVNVGHISVRQLVVYYATLGMLLLLLRRLAGIPKRNKDKAGAKKRVLLLCTISMLFVSASVYEYWQFDRDCKLVFLDVGQGDGILLRTKDGVSIMIDGGSSDNEMVGEYVIEPALKYYGMAQVDFAFVTHGDTDHISGIRYLLQTENTGIVIHNLVLPAWKNRESFSELIALAKKAGTNVIFMAEGDVLQSDIEIACLYPACGWEGQSENDGSLVLQLTYGQFAALFTGDIGTETEQELLEKGCDVDCDLLKVAHHGSKYSSCVKFLEAAKPDVSVISCGKNNHYGHPNQETLEHLEEIKSVVLRTDIYGAVVVRLLENGDYVVGQK